MNKLRRAQLKHWAKRFEALRLELQVIAEDEGASIVRFRYGMDYYTKLDNIQNELNELRGRVDEIVNT
jgi:hypothetical protein